MRKGIIYYTHNQLGEPIFSIVQKQLKKSWLPIVSCSLRPIKLGENIVLREIPGVVTMTKQILTALEVSTCEQVFFCEHDVLVPVSHFDFDIPRKDTYYYNTNVWRWEYPNDKLITYNGLKSLSGMTCYRELAVNHYRERMKLIQEKGLDNGRDPRWARVIGYEPGKTKSRGGFMEEKTDEFKSIEPMIDIRHEGTITKSKTTLSSFKHKPEGWKEIGLNEVKGWVFKDLI